MSFVVPLHVAEYTLMKWMFLTVPAVPFQFDCCVRLNPPSDRIARFPVTENVSLLLLENVQVVLILISGFVIPLVAQWFLIQSRALAQRVAPAAVLRSARV